VLVILALVAMLYVDHAALSGAVKMIVRVSLAAAPVLVYVGALYLAVGTIALGVGLLL
jgi:hypothetical protein